MSFKDEVRARLSGYSVVHCLNEKRHKAHTYREYEIQYCPGRKRKRRV